MRARGRALLLVSALAGCSFGQTTPVADTARLIGVASELEALKILPRSAAAGSPEQWKLLVLRERIDERLNLVQLQADSTIAYIDNEIARSTEVRSVLADRRDARVARANLLSALLGGGLGATSAGLQLSARQTNATVATGIAGGAVSATLAIYGIRAQRGGTLPLNTESNMLAEFFDRPELPTSRYPAVVWQFLSEIAPADPDRVTRRERLLRGWVEVKRLEAPGSRTRQKKIDQVSSLPADHAVLSIDDLEDRIAMLQDVRAKLSYLKRDLAALLGSLPEFGEEALTGSN